MFRRRVLASITMAVTAICILASASGVQAQQSGSAYSGGNALKISPVRQDVEIKAGESKVIDVYVQNLTSTKADLRGIINDFVAGKDESGQPNIILDENQAAPSHSLKQYVTKIPNFSLAPNEQKNIKVTITVPATAKPGGYFGAVRFAPQSADTEKNVTLSASVGSLVLVRVPGDIQEQVGLTSFDVRKDDTVGSFFTSGKDLKAVARFENTGDVQEQPFGKILLKKGTKILGTYEINNTQPRGNVLPDSIRRFTADLSNVGSFGKYTIEGNFGYGTKGALLTSSKTFYVVPVPVIIGIVLAILVVLFLIFILPRMIRNYNQRVVQKATSGVKRKK